MNALTSPWVNSYGGLPTSEAVDYTAPTAAPGWKAAAQARRPMVSQQRALFPLFGFAAQTNVTAALAQVERQLLQMNQNYSNQVFGSAGSRSATQTQFMRG